MTKAEISEEELWHYLNDLETIGQGSYGIIKKIDDETCIKIYYKDIFEAYRTGDISLLADELDTRREVQEDSINFSSNAKEVYENDLTKLDLLIQMGFLKRVLFCRGYKIAVEMKYYKGYLDLYEATDRLNKEQIKAVIQKIRDILDKLLNTNIYPKDLSGTNILVNPDTLDVVLIDLDDICTRYDTDEYLESNPRVKKYLLGDCNSKFKQIKAAYE